MKKLTWCLVPLVGLAALACGGEGPLSDTAPPPAVQGPGNTGPNGELQPFQRAISPGPGQGPGPGTGGNQGGGNTCESQCASSSDPDACEDACECLEVCGSDTACLAACAGG